MPWGDGRASDRFGFPHSNHRRCQMHASNICTPIADHIGTIFVAIELSQKSWLAVMHSADRSRLSRHKLESGDAAGLLGLIENVRARAGRALGSAPAVVSCYEAGYDGFWLHRRLAAAGITNFVFDPASIAVDQRRRRAKTDRIDGELLLRTLMAHCRGEPRVVRIVRVPSPEQEDVRRGSRERERLSKEQTAHTNRIKALLRTLGLAAGNPRRRDWLKWLAEQRDWQGQPVPPHYLAELKREHARLLLVGEQLGELSRGGEPTGCLRRRRGWRSRRPACDSSRALVRRLPGRWSTRCSTRSSTIAARLAATSGWRQVRGPAAGPIANRASARRAIRAPATRRSNWPGCGCGNSRTARSAAGSGSARRAPARARSALPLWLWPAS